MERDEAHPILEGEDEATLAAIDRGLKAADEGRVMPLEEVCNERRCGLQNLLHRRRTDRSASKYSQFAF
jgi:predicted transcriptional regulator